MKAITLVCLGLASALALPVAARDTRQFEQPRVYKNLAPFRSLAEFDAYRAEARRIAKARGNWWAGLPRAWHTLPLLAQTQTPDAQPCDPATENCSEELSEVAVTGMRATQQSITNNQEAGVDEGDIVKAYGRFIVVLQHGRLFSIDTGDKSGSLRLVDRVNAYQSKEVDSWIDEVLIQDDTLLVTGYSYQADSSIISLFHIDKQGVFKFIARYFIESDDYFSWENYATRIVDSKLVIYTPFDLSEYAKEEHVSLPRIRRWTEQGGYSEWQPLFSIHDVYRPIQPALTPAMHVLSACPISARGALRCESRGIVGPWEHVMYVAPDHVYLWLTPEDQDVMRAPFGDRPYCAHDANLNRLHGWPSAAYRMTISSGELTAAHTEGTPDDQFALDERPAHLWALVNRSPFDCDSDDENIDDSTQLKSLVKIPAGAFSTMPRPVAMTNYHAVPLLSGDASQQTRFADKYVLYGYARGYWGHEQNQRPGQLAVVPLATPRAASMLELPHPVDRIELFGQHAVVFGYQPNDDFAVSSVKLDAQPGRVDTQALPGMVEAEGRSHAFNGIAAKDGSGTFGIPTVDTKSSRWWGEPADVQFLTASAMLQLKSVGKLAGHPELDEKVSGYTCEVSCIDWYGNARPIFYRDRVFALTGQEFVEGDLVDGHMSEVARLNLTRTPEHPHD